MATKSPKRKIPLESTRVGVEDVSSADNPVTDADMNMHQKIGMALTTSAVGQELIICNCGWSKVTSIRGLKIHQGRMKCLKEMRPGPCIDQSLLRERSSQLSEAQQEETIHCLPSINTPVAEEGNSCTTSEILEPSQTQPAMEKNI